MELNIDLRRVGDIPVLDLWGEIDINSATALRARMETLADEGCAALVLNLERVTFIDSTGLGTVVAVWNRMGNREGAIRLACLSGALQRAFTVTGLTRVFPMYPGVPEAVAGAAP